MNVFGFIGVLVRRRNEKVFSGNELPAAAPEYRLNALFASG